MGINEYGYSYFRSHERFNGDTFNALANAPADTEYHLTGTKNGLVQSYRGPTAQALDRALDSFTHVKDRDTLALWFCHWVVVVGFLLVDRLAFSGQSARQAPRQSAAPEQHDSGLPTADEALDSAGELP